MYFFTGSNVFGQWYTGSTGNIRTKIDKFSSYHDAKYEDCNSEFHMKAAKLVYIGWSHNIFHFNNKYFISGDYKCSGKCLELVNLPKDFMDTSNMTIVSNDYRLIVVEKTTCAFWAINLENKEVKKLSLMTEVPLESDPKKSKTEDYILSCVATNDSLMFLTRNRLVYCGMIPNLIDTSHCVGEPIDVQCGNEHYMILTDIGRVYTWGNGRRLQLGHGDLSILDVPTEVEALAGLKIVKISAGGWHSLALSEFGDLYAWGWNDTGQLGIKESSDTPNIYAIPTLVDIFDDSGTAVNINVKDMACGSKHSAVLLEDNSIWTSGNNKYGQLGLSLEEYSSVYQFKKCCTFEFACESLMCGEWSTVVNVL